MTARDLEDVLWRELDRSRPIETGCFPVRVERALRDTAGYGRLSRAGLCWVLCPREHAGKLVFATTLAVTPERLAVFATTQRYFPGDDLVFALGEAH